MPDISRRALLLGLCAAPLAATLPAGDALAEATDWVDVSAIDWSCAINRNGYRVARVVVIARAKRTYIKPQQWVSVDG